MAGRCARALLRWLDRGGLITWELDRRDGDVLIITNAWPEPARPARATFLRYTVDGLIAAGVRCDVLYVRGYRGPHVYLLGCLALALLPFARPGKYRLVHSHAGETALVARFFHGAPVIASYWGSDILEPAGGGARARLKRPLASRVLRALSLLMSATTTKSAEMDGKLPAAARRRNRVIPDGVDRDRFRAIDRAEARRALGWPEHELTVISVGRRDPVKRLWLAEQACELAARELPALRWRAISDIPGEQMPLYYGAADLLLHTSASEGSPNVIKEALASNLPIVATAAGDIPELLTGVQPGAVCSADPHELARAIVACLSPPLRSNGRALSARVSLQAVTAQTLELYRALGAGPR